VRIVVVGVGVVAVVVACEEIGPQGEQSVDTSDSLTEMIQTDVHHETQHTREKLRKIRVMCMCMADRHTDRRRDTHRQRYTHR